MNDLTYQDIEHYFQHERFESDQLEFKSVNPNEPLEAKFEIIYKGICAQLNSSGDLLIWGAPEGVKVEGE